STLSLPRCPLDRDIPVLYLKRRFILPLSKPPRQPASPDSQPTEQHPTGKRRRLSVPKDPRAAAKRLRTQRQGDDENLEALYKLLVPRGAGVVQKKDRLSMILRYARKWMQTQGGSIQQSMTLEQTRDCRSTSPSGSQQGESMESY
ncbi:hypothetical protein F5888DRAFT_1635487, partial [Russula emetica]